MEGAFAPSPCQAGTPRQDEGPQTGEKVPVRVGVGLWDLDDLSRPLPPPLRCPCCPPRRPGKDGPLGGAAMGRILHLIELN